MQCSIPEHGRTCRLVEFYTTASAPASAERPLGSGCAAPTAMSVTAASTSVAAGGVSRTPSSRSVRLASMRSRTSQSPAGTSGIANSGNRAYPESSSVERLRLREDSLE